MFDYVAFKSYIEENGLKQKFLAQRLGVSEQTLSGILSGRVKCSLEIYVGICRALSLPLGKFINEPDTAA
ncbi:MAG: helix-turn-helix transcriptional regulator [Selenomonadaceae bacterium]|nr:helix-turn-helix transcriptional regulator [Selenomonadaceae bacterium]